MIGRTPGNITAIRPMKDGVIADFQITQAMLKYFYTQGNGEKPLIKPRVIVCVPSGVTEVEKGLLLTRHCKLEQKKRILLKNQWRLQLAQGCLLKNPTAAWLLILAAVPARLPLYHSEVLL